MSPTGLPNALIGATAFSPSATLPEWQTKNATIGLPCISFAIHGAGGARRMPATTANSGGALAAIEAYSSSTFGASSAGHAMAPPTISGPTGPGRHSELLTTPEFAPPPPRPPNKAEVSFLLAPPHRPAAP